MFRPASFDRVNLFGSGSVPRINGFVIDNSQRCHCLTRKIIDRPGRYPFLRAAE